MVDIKPYEHFSERFGVLFKYLDFNELSSGRDCMRPTSESGFNQIGVLDILRRKKNYPEHSEKSGVGAH